MLLRKYVTADNKTSKEIENTVPHLQSAWDAANFLKLLIKNSKEGGPLQGRAANWGLINNRTLGTINALSGKIQGDVSRANVARPSGISLKWAEKIKTDIKQPWKYNLGQADAIINNLRTDYNNDKKHYNKITGKKLPELSEFNEKDPTIQWALKAIMDGKDIDKVLLKLQQIREQQNGSQ